MTKLRLRTVWIILNDLQPTVKSNRDDDFLYEHGRLALASSTERKKHINRIKLITRVPAAEHNSAEYEDGRKRLTILAGTIAKR